MNGNPTCPTCRSPMQLRSSRHGAFYGCARYKEGCKTTIDATDATKLAQAYAGAAPIVSPVAVAPAQQQIPAPLQSAIAHQSAIKIAGKRMASQFAGVCACGSAFLPQQTIVFRDGKVRGCPACELGVRLERERLASLAALPGAVTREVAALTDEQRLVASGYTTGYARLVAAAGSGKTRTFASLVGKLISHGVDPARILAMTFTKEGAKEMTARLAHMFGPSMQDVAVGTLHSFSGRWLKDYYQRTMQGLQAVRIKNVLDGSGKPDRNRFDPAILRDLPRDPEGLAVKLLGIEEITWMKLKQGLGVDKKPSYFLAKDYLRAVGWLTANIIAPDSENALVVEEQFGLIKLREFYGLYLRALDALGMSVFDEWVYLAGKLARDEDPALPTGFPTFVAGIAAQFDYVMIDEAQDNSAAQLILAHKVASSGKGNLLLIADARQAIYEFRGAMPEFVLEAEKYTGRDVKTLYLTANFRSASPIVALGNLLVKGAAWSIGPEVTASRIGAEVPPENALTVWDPFDTVDEGERCAAVCESVLKSLPTANPHPRPVAILSRTNGGLGPSEAALLRKQIPYIISSGSGFFNRWEVRVAMAHLSLAAGVVSQDVIKLATQAPRRALGNAFAKAVLERLGENAMGREQSGLPPLNPPEALVFAMQQAMQRSSKFASDGRKLVADIQAIIDEPGITSQAQRACSYVRDWLKAKAKAAEAADTDDNRLENLRVLSEVAVRFESIGELVHYAAIGANAQTDADKPAITLSTIHRCKGLEFPGVIIVSAFKGHFPHEKANQGAIEGEERRIEYVAVTRARDRLVISTPVQNNRRQMTAYAWSARLARRLLKVDEENKPKAAIDRFVAAKAERELAGRVLDVTGDAK